MESLKVYRGEHLLAQITLGERPVELGRAQGCDVVVDDPEIADRHWLALRKHGTVVAYDVSGRGGRVGRHLPLGERIALGRDHSVERIDSAPSSTTGGKLTRTERLVDAPSSAACWLVVGRGADARRVRLGEHPVCVGRAPECEVVLDDPAVSLQHCRFEPVASGIVVRDLGSRNGTFLHGARLDRAVVGGGACLRVGRSDLFVHTVAAAAHAQGSTLVFESPAMLALLGEVERVAALSWPVLVHGPSGAGKEGIAALLHERGPRRGRPFVTLNAGGVPADLVESELFGHERGAFTGAQQARRGVFEQADGGTLFLDEIGELPLALQSRLLRVLDGGELRRVGAEGVRRVDVRVVCATHRDLWSLVAAGQFRLDLYHRIAAIVLEVPPLCQRPEDVQAIAASVLAGLSSELGPRELAGEALQALLRHDWPGNVRELRNTLCSAALRASSGVIGYQDVARVLWPQDGVGGIDPELDVRILATVDRCRGNLTRAASALGIPRTTLRDRVRVLRGEPRR
jgi:pSer/pThr/pTyr-binding forkhead associated (FHA) protein